MTRAPIRWFAALMSALICTAARADAAPPLQWQGQYKDGSFTTLTIQPGGQFKMATTCPFVGDVGIPVTLQGSVTLSADGWLRLSVREKDRDCPLPSHFDYYGVARATTRFLMSDWDLTVWVNQINNRSTQPSEMLLRTPSTGDSATMAFDAHTPVPARYRALLRTEPLQAAVTRARPTGSEIVNMASDPMRPAVMKQRFSARITIDRGAAHGVFVGMRVYLPQAELRIDAVRADEADATQQWHAPGQMIAAGSAVSSQR